MYTVLPKKYGPCNLQQAIWEEICIKIKDFFWRGVQPCVIFLKNAAFIHVIHLP